MKIHRKGLVIAAVVLFFCGLCAVRFTFAGKYIMIPYWTKSTSPKGMYYGVPLGIIILAPLLSISSIYCCAAGMIHRRRLSPMEK